MARSAMDRFLEKTEFSFDTGCVLWTAALDESGYGSFRADGRSVRAHRWIWEQLHGPVPARMDLDHVRARGCTNRHCVNPDHLEPVTHRENVLRGDAPAAVNARKARCVRGHEFVIAAGRRTCPTCSRESKRAYKRRNRIAQPVDVCQAFDCSNRIPDGTRSSRRYCCDNCRIRAWKAAA